MKRNVILGLVVTLAVAPLAWAGAAEAAKAFEEGKALLAKAEFDKALAAFKTAAAADPEDKAILAEFQTLKRVISIRTALAKTEQADEWKQMSTALYGYYMRKGINSEALTLAGQMYDKAKDADAALALAGAQLAADKNEDAAKLLAGLPEAQQTAHTNVLRGIALARTGKSDDAKALAKKIELPKEPAADLLYDAAALHALLGDTDQAVKLLTSSFEATPATALDEVKAHAKADKDLANLTKGEQFTKVLATESKVKGCGTGSACGGCKSKDSCASGKGDKKDAGCADHGKTETKDGDKPADKKDGEKKDEAAKAKP